MAGTFWQRYRFLFPSRKIYALAIAGAPAALAFGAARPSQWNESLFVFLLFCALPAVVFSHDVEVMRKQGADLRRVTVLPKFLSSFGLSARAAGYARISFGGRYAISSPTVNSLLNAKEIPFEIDKRAYVLPENVRPLAPFLLRSAHEGGKILFNEPKLRLETDLCPAGILAAKPVLLRRTDYFSGLLSNDLAGVQIKRADEVVFRGSELVGENGISFDLADSPCSNHLGVSALAFSSDGALVLTQTSSRSAQNAGQLTPSASGSVSPDDLKKLSQPTLQRLIAAAIERELREELGLGSRETVSVRTRLVGFARFLNRGGKPEFYGVSVLNVPLAELKIDEKEQLLVEKIRIVATEGHNLAAIEAAARNLLEHGRATLSPALYLNLTFFAACVRTNPQLIGKLLDIRG